MYTLNDYIFHKEEKRMNVSSWQFWDIAVVWTLVILLSAVFIILLISNMLIKAIKPLRKALIPAPVLGGFLLLIVFMVLKATLGNWEYQTEQMSAPVKLFGSEGSIQRAIELLTYHGLGIGFCASALKNKPKKEGEKKERGVQKDIFNGSVMCVTGYLGQALLGILVTVILFFCGLITFPAAGVLLPMGFGQGPGQALNWGKQYEAYQLDANHMFTFAGGKDFALAIAAVGFIAASVGGIIFLNWQKHKKNPKILARVEHLEVEPTVENFVSRNEIPDSGSIDKTTIQIGLVLLVYALSFGLIWGISALCDASGVAFLINTLKPLFWGFNFIIGTGVAVLVKTILNKLKEKGAIKRVYINNYMMDRISGVAFDVMVVCAIAAIDLVAFTNVNFIVPLIVVCLVGTVGTYALCLFLAKKLYPTYWEEMFLVMFGMLTGTASTGVILLREIDPQFKTRANNNMVFQTLYSVALGAPILLCMSSIGTNWTQLIIWCSIFVVYFLVLMFLWPFILPAFKMLGYKAKLSSWKNKSKKDPEKAGPEPAKPEIHFGTFALGQTNAAAQPVEVVTEKQKTTTK